MSTLYYIACRDCKVTRGLDKFDELISVANREEALDLGERMQQPGAAFRAALMASFLWHHKGHNCAVFSEHDEALCGEMDPFIDPFIENKNGFIEDKDFWPMFSVVGNSIEESGESIEGCQDEKKPNIDNSLAETPDGEGRYTDERLRHLIREARNAMARLDMGLKHLSSAEIQPQSRAE